MAMTTFHTAEMDNQNILYREAGHKDAPVVILLHGYTSLSHMFRNLIPALAHSYLVIAPDMPGIGFSQAAASSAFTYTFEHLTDVMDSLIKTRGLNQYALYLFDYGAPVGLRLVLRHPEQINAIISQNGNAYVEGLSEAWIPIRKHWKTTSDQNRTALRFLLTPETTQWQYTYGVADTAQVAPESYTLDSALLARPENDEIQLDLFLNYASNIALYLTFQTYFREYHPPLQVVWGKNDPFFLPQGAEAFKRDIPNAEILFFDTGHFALETHHAEITAVIQDFLARTVISTQNKAA